VVLCLTKIPIILNFESIISNYNVRLSRTRFLLKSLIIFAPEGKSKNYLLFIFVNDFRESI